MESLDLVIREVDRFGFSPGRILCVAVLAGLLMRLVKARFAWPQWLPVLNLGFALLCSGAMYARSGLGVEWLLTFAIEAVFGAAIAAYGNDALKLATVKLLERVPFIGVAGAEAIATKLWGDPKSGSGAASAGAEVLAALMFEAYRKSAAGVTYDGKPIPKWEDLTDAVRRHWTAAARATL